MSCSNLNYNFKSTIEKVINNYKSPKPDSLVIEATQIYRRGKLSKPITPSPTHLIAGTQNPLAWNGRQLIQSIFQNLVWLATHEKTCKIVCSRAMRCHRSRIVVWLSSYRWLSMAKWYNRIQVIILKRRHWRLNDMGVLTAVHKIKKSVKKHEKLMCNLICEL